MKRNCNNTWQHLRVGDWVVGSFVERMVCLAGPAIAPNGYPIIYDRRWRLGFVEKSTVVFYGDEHTARRVFEALSELTKRQCLELYQIQRRHTGEINDLVPFLKAEIKNANPHSRAEVGQSKLYACFDWPRLVWTGREPPPLDEHGEAIREQHYPQTT